MLTLAQMQAHIVALTQDRQSVLTAADMTTFINEAGNWYYTTYADRVTPNGLYIRLSGTSASAPVVSGVAALVLQARPGLKPKNLKPLLQHPQRNR